MLGKLSLRAAIAAIFLTVCVAAATACPVITAGHQSMSHTAVGLYSPVAYSIVAGGNINLANCRDLPGIGYVIQSPDFSMLYQSDMAYELELRTEGSCDTVLLVNSGSANWYFDDDSGSNYNGRIRITNPSSGRYDIWVGTYSQSNCNTRLILETF